jgi:tetratricopeptide (TPR) repeat protein
VEPGQVERPARGSRRLLQIATALLAGLVVAGGVLAARQPMRGLLARRDLAQARELTIVGRVEDARAALHRALRRKPDLAAARQALGALELGAGHLEQAFLHFQALTDQQPASADAWLGLARVRALAGQPVEAAAALDEVLDLDPARVDARSQRAALRLELGQDEGALLDAAQATRADRKDVRAWRALARATTRLKGTAAGLEVLDRPVTEAGSDPALVEERSAIQSGRAGGPPRTDRLRESPGDRAERWPGALGAMMREFVGKAGRQDWNGAEALAAAAALAYPETLMAPWLRGVVELSNRRLDSAERLFHEALAISPRSHRPITNLVTIWSTQNDVLHTADRLVALAERDPGFIYPLPIAARAYLEGDQPARAESTARLALAALPDSPLPYRDVASLYLELDRASDAVAICEQGLQRFPNDARLQLLRARASTLLGDREHAIQQYERVLPRWPDFPIAAAELAALLMESRSDTVSRQRALDLVRSLERDGPMEPEVLGAMGRVYLQAGDPQAALAVLEPAVRGSPGDPALHLQLALARKATGSPDLALIEVRRSLASGRPFPGEPEARRLLRELGGEK